MLTGFAVAGIYLLVIKKAYCFNITKVLLSF